MILEGVQKVRIATIRYDKADIQRRMRDPRVIELSKSRDTDGQVAPVVISEGSRELVCGRDRIAADLLRGAKTVEAKTFRGTPQERRRLELIENLRRRNDDQPALLAELVALALPEAERELAEARAAGEHEDPPRPGRPQTARGLARERVAAETGRTVEAVRKAEQRAAAEAPLPDTRPTKSAPQPWYAALPSSAQASEVELALRLLANVDRELQRLQGAVTAAQATPLGAYLHQRLHPKLHEVAALARSLAPAAVCFACKADPAGMATCKVCRGHGVVTADQVAAAPKPKAAPAAKPNGKRNTIVLPGGETYEPGEGEAF